MLAIRGDHRNTPIRSSMFSGRRRVMAFGLRFQAGTRHRLPVEINSDGVFVAVFLKSTSTPLRSSIIVRQTSVGSSARGSFEKPQALDFDHRELRGYLVAVWQGMVSNAGFVYNDARGVHTRVAGMPSSCMAMSRPACKWGRYCIAHKFLYCVRRFGVYEVFYVYLAVVFAVVDYVFGYHYIRKGQAEHPGNILDGGFTLKPAESNNLADVILAVFILNILVTSPLRL